jgi:DNA-binding MarR family transcriptional regulator
MDDMGRSHCLSETERGLWFAFMEASRLIERRLDQRLRSETGITHAQYEILTRLSMAPDRKIRMSELAEQVVSTRSGLTYQVTQLETRGLVSRRACPGDDRGVMAHLTDEGEVLLDKLVPVQEAIVQECLTGRLTPEQLEALSAAMCGMRRYLRTGEAPVTCPREQQAD